MNRIALLIGVLILIAPSESRAWEPVTGVSLGGRWVDVNPKEGESTDYYGGQLRMQGDVLGLEVSVDRLNRSSGGTTVMDTPVMATLLARLVPESRLTPFLLGGVAWYNTSIETTNPFTGNKHRDSDTRLGYHAGFGLELFLNRVISVDGTWRHIWVEELSSKDASALNKKWDSTGDMFTLGLNLHF